MKPFTKRQQNEINALAAHIRAGQGGPMIDDAYWYISFAHELSAARFEDLLDAILDAV